MKLPSARTAEIIEQDLGKELLIYDLRTNKAYTLNETLMKVYRACNGTQTFVELKRQYRFTDDLIHLALDELQKNDLVTGYESNHFGDLSRRQVIRRVGLASVIALPVIAGIVAPAAAQAASTSNGCTQSSDCPPPSAACRTAVCTAGACGIKVSDYHTVVAGGVCDQFGNVVQCLGPTDCPGQETECQRPDCYNNYCTTVYTATCTPTSDYYFCDGSGNKIRVARVYPGTNISYYSCN